MKPIAHIEDWVIVDRRDGSASFLVGKISDHPEQARFQTETQVTSPIVRIYYGCVETENTMYILGSSRRGCQEIKVV